MSNVLVLNASLEPHQTVDVQHAMRMLFRGVARVHEHAEDQFFGPFPMPKVLVLVRYVWISRVRRVQYSREAVLERDKHQCAYCRSHAQTVDHINPRRLGGTSTWMNTVACCWDCNQYKGGRTLQESGMVLLFQPYVPTRNQVGVQRR